MRRPLRSLIIANWKMNTTLADATFITNSVKNAARDLDLDIVLCPPSVWLVPMAEMLEKTPKNLYLGAQNMWFADKGPMTGEISPLMIKDFVDLVIIGHSERRLNFHETNELVNDKMHAAIHHGITPLLCVGELKKKLSEKKERGRPTNLDMRSDVIHQLLESIEGVSRVDLEKVVICYEPVWAISKGTVSSRNAADGAYVNAVVQSLRIAIAKKYGESLSQRIKILYGGSVDEKNITEFIYQPEIDGALVGGASLKVKEFLQICKEASGKE